LIYPNVDKVFSVIENGMTEPLDAVLSTGDRAIVKTFNNNGYETLTVE